MLEVEPSGRVVACSGGDKAVAGAASEAFARRLHHRYAFVEMPSAAAGAGLSCRYAILSYG